MAITNVFFSGFLSRFFRRTGAQTTASSPAETQKTKSNIASSRRKVQTNYTPSTPRYTGGIFTSRDIFRYSGRGTPRDTTPTVVSDYTQSLQRRLGGISSSSRSLFSSGINNMANYFSSSRYFSWA